LPGLPLPRSLNISARFAILLTHAIESARFEGKDR
jgi:hypothetical protein